MYILIEEREVYDAGYDSVNYNHTNIGVSDSLGDLLEYCLQTYYLSEAKYNELCKYQAVDDVRDKYRCSVNLNINVVKVI